ncbi:hypothetical protein OH77DRAFT_801798 [Trametes cingulata]|nr:hypothetical protein OH77DRAFT_801798 [Trametes cingulata]
METLLAAIEEVSTAPATSKRKICLDGLPPELIHKILLLVPQPYVLNFGLTSRRNLELCQLALHRKVTLTPANQPSFHASKIAQAEPSLRWVHDLQLGRSWDDYSSGWDALSDSSILTAFPNLRSLDASNHPHMEGWAGVSRVLQALPPTVIEFKGNVDGLGDSPQMVWPSNRVFPNYRTLVLDWENPLRQITAERFEVPRTLSVNFPNLVKLSLAFPVPPIGFDKFLSSSHFPHLESCDLVIRASPWDSPVLGLDVGHGLATFLSRHANTLRRLCLPNWAIPRDVAAAFSQLPLKLSHLHACIHMATTISHSLSLSATLHSFHVESCMHYWSFEALPEALPRTFDAVDEVVVDATLRLPEDLDQLPRLAPKARSLTIHCGRASTSMMVSMLEGKSTLLRNYRELEEIVILSQDGHAAKCAPVRDPIRGNVTLKAR